MMECNKTEDCGLPSDYGVPKFEPILIKENQCTAGYARDCASFCNGSEQLPQVQIEDRISEEIRRRQDEARLVGDVSGLVISAGLLGACAMALRYRCLGAAPGLLLALNLSNLANVTGAYGDTAVFIANPIIKFDANRDIRGQQDENQLGDCSAQRCRTACD